MKFLTVKNQRKKNSFFPSRTSLDRSRNFACSCFDILFLSVSALIGKLPQRSSLWALSLSLSAVNLSQSARAKMSAAQLAEIYVTAATALRALLGHHLSFLPVSFADATLPKYPSEL